MSKTIQQVNSKMNSKALIAKAAKGGMDRYEISELTGILLRRFPNSKVIFALKDSEGEHIRLLKVSNTKKRDSKKIHPPCCQQ